MQKIELVVKATSWEDAKDILGGVNIHQKSRSEYKEINDLFIVKVLLEEPLAGQDYANIKNSLNIGILSDSTAQKRAEDVFREIHKVETQLRKILLHVSDVVNAYYEILLQVGQYTHEFSDNVQTPTNKGTLDVMLTHITMGELLQLLEFDYSWSSRPLDTTDLNTILRDSESFEDFKSRVAGHATPKSIWEVITEQVLGKDLPWKDIEKKLRRLKKYRNDAAHHFIFTEKRKIDAIKLAEEVLEILKPKKAVSQMDLDYIKSVAESMTKNLSSIVNTGLLSELAKHQSTYAQSVVSQLMPKIDVSSFISPIDTAALFTKININTTQASHALRNYIELSVPRTTYPFLSGKVPCDTTGNDQTKESTDVDELDSPKS